MPSGVVPIAGGAASVTTSVGVTVAVAVAVEVEVLVPVGVGESVPVEVDVFTKVVGRVGTCVETVVAVDAGLDVAVWVGGKYTRVFVGLFAAMAVSVTAKTVVATVGTN